MEERVPGYFAKVLNSTNWIGINIELDGTPLDLANCTVSEFRRVLNMKEGTLSRSFTATTQEGKEVKVESIRIVSMVRQEIGAIRYSLTPLNFAGNITVTPTWTAISRTRIPTMTRSSGTKWRRRQDQKADI